MSSNAVLPSMHKMPTLKCVFYNKICAPKGFSRKYIKVWTCFAFLFFLNQTDRMKQAHKWTDKNLIYSRRRTIHPPVYLYIWFIISLTFFKRKEIYLRNVLTALDKGMELLTMLLNVTSLSKSHNFLHCPNSLLEELYLFVGINCGQPHSLRL